MAMMNYQIPPAYPHSMQNYMDYSIHNPHIHNPHVHSTNLPNHQHVQTSHFHSHNIQNPHIQYVQDEYYPDDSDDESNLTSEDYEEDRMSDDLLEREPSAVDQLLDFAAMVNQDIQKFFGKKRILDEPELIADCNKKVRLSGRELYYADLLRVAQQGDSADPCQDVAEPSRIVRYGSGENSHDSSSNWSPKSADSSGLGPLEELFHYAERNLSYNNLILPTLDYPTSNGARSWLPPAENLNAPSFDGKTSTLSWRDRALPKSFFIEPSLSSACHTAHIDHRFNATLSVPVANQYSVSVSNSNHHDAPDFSDLMATMDADDDHGLPRVTPVHG